MKKGHLDCCDKKMYDLGIADGFEPWLVGESGNAKLNYSDNIKVISFLWAINKLIAVKSSREVAR